MRTVSILMERCYLAMKMKATGPCLGRGKSIEIEKSEKLMMIDGYK